MPGDSVPIPPDTYARVVTDDLRVRSKPGVSKDSTKLEPLLQDGVQVVVLDGPVQASGYDWYLVQPTIPSDTAEQYPFGWVAAAGKDGEPWIESKTVECPPLPTSAEQLDELYQGLPCSRDHLLRREGDTLPGSTGRSRGTLRGGAGLGRRPVVVRPVRER